MSLLPARMQFTDPMPMALGPAIPRNIPMVKEKPAVKHDLRCMTVEDRVNAERLVPELRYGYDQGKVGGDETAIVRRHGDVIEFAETVIGQNLKAHQKDLIDKIFSQTGTKQRANATRPQVDLLNALTNELVALGVPSDDVYSRGKKLVGLADGMIMSKNQAAQAIDFLKGWKLRVGRALARQGNVSNRASDDYPVPYESLFPGKVVYAERETKSMAGLGAHYAVLDEATNIAPTTTEVREFYKHAALNKLRPGEREQFEARLRCGVRSQ